MRSIYHVCLNPVNGISNILGGHSMPEKFIHRVVNLEERDYSIVQRFAKEKGLGGKGVSLLCASSFVSGSN